MLKWLQKKADERREAQERKRQEMLRIQEQERRAAEMRRQNQDNIIAIVERNEIPDIDWESAVGRLPFRFMKSEHLIFVFPSVGYLEQRVKREIVGRSTGGSVRVAKGVSLRVGSSRGTPVETEYMEHHGAGMLAVTSKHLYFNGAKSFRIPFAKIVAVEGYADSVAVTRDRARPQPEFFVVGTDNAWFAHELIQAVPSMELPRKEVERRSVEDFHLIDYDSWDDDLALED